MNLLFAYWQHRYSTNIHNVVSNSFSTFSISEEPKEAYMPVWEVNLNYSYDFLDMVLSFDEDIIDSMIGPNKTCEYLHHKSYFLPELSRIENFEFHVRLVDGIDMAINTFPNEGIFAEGNMQNISTTISINIYTKPYVMENVHIGANFSP